MFTVIFRNSSKFTGLWDHLTRQSSREIFKILRRMKQRRLMRFLKFMKHSFLHDATVKYSEDCFKHFQNVLACCPTVSLTRFLSSIDKQCVVNLLKRRLDIWTRFFTGLLNSNIDRWINFLMMVYDDIDFIVDLISEFANQASMNDLPLEFRQNIFSFVGRNPCIALLVVQRLHSAGQSLTIQDRIRSMNEWLRLFAEQHGLQPVSEWRIANIENIMDNEEDPEIQLPEHRPVNPEDFVSRELPLLNPVLGEDYLCIICHSNPDERYPDRTQRVFRSMPCCFNLQVACHGCLVEWATSCNTPNPDNPFKNTSDFTCPSCRGITGFFRDEN
jgi:hypothetical protein